MRATLRCLLLAGALVTMVGCRSLQVDAGFHPPAELTATAQAETGSAAATSTPLPRPTVVPVTPAPASTTVAPTSTASGQPTPIASATQVPGPGQPSASPSPGVTATATSTDVVRATQTLLDYFSAIEKHDYPTAYQLWAKSGAASGQTYAEFKKGYADTVHVSVQFGQPTVKSAGASPTVSVPVTLASVVNVPNQSQRVRHYQGSYALQADPSGTGSWRIASASVSETQAGAQPPADVADPLALQRAYFDAIGRKELARAYTYWDQLGQASGQTFAEFSKGFVATGAVSVDLGQPQIGAAAGSSYAQVPVVIVAKQTDQTTRTYCGTYTDRLADVPPFDQLGWRIDSATVVSVANVEPGSPAAKKLLGGDCPAATPRAAGTPTPGPSAACAAGDLSAKAMVQGATGNLAGNITFTNTSSKPCTLQGRPDVRLVDANGQVLPVGQVAEPGSESSLGSPVRVAPGQAALVFVIWLVNYCGPTPAPPISMSVSLPDGQGTLKAPLTDVKGTPLGETPRCDQPGSGNSGLSVGLFQAAS